MLNGNSQIKWKASSGESGSQTSSTGREAATAGVSVNYGSLPRNDFGLLFGLGLLKKLEDNKTSPSSTLASSGPMTQIRPDINAAYSLANGLYGAAGANLSHLIIESEIDSVISTFGYGLQAQVGFIPMRNMGMDVGYYVSRHPVKNMTISSGTTTIKIDSADSYVDLTQLRLRLSYLF